MIIYELLGVVFKVYLQCLVFRYKNINLLHECFIEIYLHCMHYFELTQCQLLCEKFREKTITVLEF